MPGELISFRITEAEKQVLEELALPKESLSLVAQRLLRERLGSNSNSIDNELYVHNGQMDEINQRFQKIEEEIKGLKAIQQKLKENVFPFGLPTYNYDTKSRKNK